MLWQFNIGIAEVQNTSGIGEIINSKGLHQGGWYQTGGVVFYRAVTISNCKFSNLCRRFT